MSHFLQNLINALTHGSSYALIALGYTMVYGVLRLINFAHGDVFMLGAFVGAFVGQRLAGPDANSQSYGQALTGLYCAVCFCACIGYLIERLAYRPLRRSPKLSSLITAIGVSLLIEYLAQMSWSAVLFDVLISLAVAVFTGFILFQIAKMAIRKIAPVEAARRKFHLSALVLISIVASLFLASHFATLGGTHGTFFGPTPQRYLIIAGSGDALPSIEKALGVSVVMKEVIVLVTTLVTLIALYILVKHTRMGKAMRAVSQNYDAARLMGIDLNAVISFTFVLGSSLAAIGGCLSGLNESQCTPLMGLMPGLKAFVAAVIGGIGNIPGAAAGGLILGIIETFVSSIQYHNEAVLSPYKDAIAFVILIAVLLVKPEGIFGKAVPEKV